MFSPYRASRTPKCDSTRVNLDQKWFAVSSAAVRKTFRPLSLRTGKDLALIVMLLSIQEKGDVTKFGSRKNQDPHALRPSRVSMFYLMDKCHCIRSWPTADPSYPDLKHNPV